MSNTERNGLTIRKAAPEDAEAYSAFSRRLAIETFAAQNDPHEFAIYLAQTFGTKIQEREIRSPDVTVLLGEMDGEIAAYSFVRLGGRVPSFVTGAAPMEIARFYIDSVWHGRGIAQAMMLATAQEAAEQGAETLWLGVWEHNPRAIAFYGKCGFERAGSHIFMVGSDAQTDHVLEAPVAVVLQRMKARAGHTNSA
jgi:GNAT superfamily N-acetyltransferase